MARGWDSRTINSNSDSKTIIAIRNILSRCWVHNILFLVQNAFVSDVCKIYNPMILAKFEFHVFASSQTLSKKVNPDSEIIAASTIFFFKIEAPQRVLNVLRFKCFAF